MFNSQLKILTKSFIPKSIINWAIIFSIFRLAISICLQMNMLEYDKFGLKTNRHPVVKNLLEIILDGNKTLKMNPDEEENYIIAKNHLIGHGYTVYDIKTNTYIKTAYHSSFTVFLYEWVLLYLGNFDLFIIGILFLSAILHFVALLAFYKINTKLHSISFSYIGFFIYALFPSIFFYIGALFSYENIALSCIVIGICLLISTDKLNNLYLFKLFAVFLFSIISVFLRAQTLPIWGLIFFVYLLCNNSQKPIYRSAIFFLFITIMYLMHIPVFHKNESMFGERVVSTQFGDALFQGANPKARGSWDGSGKAIESALSDLKNRNSLSGLDVSHVLERKAITWIVGHPLDYTFLLARKLAIFFLPQNYEVLPFSKFYNPINAVVYLGFFLFLFSQIKRPQLSSIDTLLLAPILGSLLLSLLFFVGYRWRYYAEPFMIIFSISWLQSFIANHILPNK